MNYRKKPVVIEAVQWTGDNLAQIKRFTTDPGYGLGLPSFETIDSDRDSYPVFTAEVYDKLHATWVKLRPGDWVIKGIRGEFYPCDVAVFAKTYDRVQP